ncbi:MAG: hypothetical protein M4579_000556 [Chaenotheca gracillima]|nr:MAG: hypothetical protein M4579_000556 [Chaenotheca gracillima]
MDFWARLIGGVGASPASKSVTDNNPQQRLARFKRVFNQLIQTWRNGTATNDSATLDTIRSLLARLTSTLRDESHSPPPHPCLSFATTSNLHAIIGHIGSRSRHDGVIREVINAFSTLIDCEDEFLQDEGFAASLVDFVRRVGGGSGGGGNGAGGPLVVIGDEAEGDVIELMFGVAAKIRLQPEILPVWFTAREDTLSDRARAQEGDGSGEDEGDEEAQQQDFAGITKKEDFPLFYLLIDYVHHEGRVGDFARTGLLYIIESASISEQLEQWIIESDLATLMASGLGALYSQLSRKLAIAYPVDELPAILALSDYTEPPQSSDIEISTSPEFQLHLDTFLSYLAFWQDVLDHCKSVEVRQTLLDHFRILFLQQLLYPSLLESSDIDGGSSVAVLTYLRRILESLNHPDLIHLILEYLLAFPEDSNAKVPTTPKSPRAARRRRTLDLMTETESGADKPTPTLFNLVDLIITSLRSRSQQTKAATLKLVSVILRRHHRYALSTLIHTVPVSRSSTSRTIGGLNAEIRLLFSLASDIGIDQGCDEAYDNHLKDNFDLLESHSCTDSLLNTQNRAEPRRISTNKVTLSTGPREVYPHMLRPEDPLLNSMVDTLASFFSNTVETNLNLTAAIIDLATCGYINLEGWLAVSPEAYEYDDKDTASSSASTTSSNEEDLPSDPYVQLEEARLRALSSAQREPSWSSENTPPILSTLQSLTATLHYHRTTIQDFDTLLAERRQAFQVSDELKEALASTSLSLHPKTPITPSTSTAVSAVPESIPSHVLNESAATHSLSPRGRAPPVSSSPSPAAAQAARLSNIQSPRPEASPVRRSALSQSPVRASDPAPFVQPPTFSSTRDANILTRRINIGQPAVDRPHSQTSNGIVGGSGSAEVPEHEREAAAGEEAVTEEDEDGEKEDGDEKETITISHLLTNSVVLQEFILELAALVQVRGGLFGDVAFLR